MKEYGIMRKISLTKYGCPYETMDLVVEGCQSWEEAEAEIQGELKKIHEIFQPMLGEKLKKLKNKAKLTLAEEREREDLLSAMTISPF